MNKKILFVSILAALLMVSMPFVSTLQAAYVQPQSTSVTKTTTTAVNINLNQQHVISMLQMAKIRSVTPSDKALCQQAILYVYTYGMNLNCGISLLLFSITAALTIGWSVAAVWNIVWNYFINGEGSVDFTTIIAELELAGISSEFALYFLLRANDVCFPDGGMAQQSSQTTTSTNNAPQTTGCSLCSK